ncbi:MAG: type II toxin-antitoxin system RelE/ParE family toxin [Treponema sp.]|nr:type II toxin-antitoxin system RelE/ParE family toxin [Treponema sp.]
MIQYTVQFTESAREDFFNLTCYETTHPSCVSAEKLKIAIASLELMPERFPFFEEKPLVDNQIRVMKEGNTCIFYFIDKEKKVVTIIRMMFIQNVAVEQQLITDLTEISK